RRRQAAERRPVPPGKDRPAAAPISPLAGPTRPRVSPRPAPGRQTVPPTGKIPETVPVTQTTAAAEILAVASVLHAPLAPSAPSAQPAAVATEITVAVEPAPQTLPPLVELLRAEDNLRTAVILHEIFSPPRCRRPAVG
ncbi:MAG TPA: hypothetical protein VKU02_07715, partial [Gemmataceae bacterium]|nr:hypothetical protein [Gemmataceae bacterium]